MSNHVTIADVANHLGVSKSTVSHALSGKRRISTEVRRQVIEAVEELGYRPNFAARIMNTRRTGLIGVLVESLKNPYTTALLEELDRELSRHSLRMVLGTTNNPEDGRELLVKFSDGMVDGILNNLPGLDEAEARRLADGVPVVTYLRHTESPLVIDFAAGTRTALAYLTELGHRDIAIVSLGSRAEPGKPDPCLAAYREWSRCPNDPSLIFRVPEGTTEAGFELAEALFASRATAVLAGNDAVSAGMIQWAIDRNIRIPERMSIVGFDNSSLAKMTFPPLTTLDLPIGKLAAHTVRVLLAAILPDEPLPEPLTIVPELIVRKSTIPFQVCPLK